MKFSFYNKFDEKKESISVIDGLTSRLQAAKYFAKLKALSLKDFLRIFGIKKIQ